MIEPVPSESCLPLLIHVRGTALHVPVPSQRGAVTGLGDVMTIVQPRQCPPPEPTGCARHDAVVAMLHQLESTYTLETGWDGRYDDTYGNGEMLSYRRIQLSGNIPQPIIIFCEDEARSYCYISADGMSCSVYDETVFSDALAALEAGRESFASIQDTRSSAG